MLGGVGEEPGPHAAKLLAPELAVAPQRVLDDPVVELLQLAAVRLALRPAWLWCAFAVLVAIDSTEPFDVTPASAQVKGALVCLSRRPQRNVR